MAVQALLFVICPGGPASLDANLPAKKCFKEATLIPLGIETNSLISANPFFQFLRLVTRRALLARSADDRAASG
jgi:hypothetical protein